MGLQGDHAAKPSTSSCYSSRTILSRFRLSYESMVIAAPCTLAERARSGTARTRSAVSSHCHCNRIGREHHPGAHTLCMPRSDDLHENLGPARSRRRRPIDLHPLRHPCPHADRKSPAQGCSRELSAHRIIDAPPSATATIPESPRSRPLTAVKPIRHSSRVAQRSGSRHRQAAVLAGWPSGFDPRRDEPHLLHAVRHCAPHTALIVWGDS